jgi:hypothetical protein
MRINLFELVLSLKHGTGDFKGEPMYFPDGRRITPETLKQYKTVICLNDK